MNTVAEATALLGAGTVTTSWTLAVITYHLLNKPELLAKLTRELEQAVEDPGCLPPLSVLENLPYLHAVVQEGLRLSYGKYLYLPDLHTYVHVFFRNPGAVRRRN